MLQTGNQHYAEALNSYQNAVAIMSKDEGNYDDASCDLAMLATKIGNMLAKLGRWKEADAEYAKAIEKARISFSLEQHGHPRPLCGCRSLRR